MTRADPDVVREAYEDYMHGVPYTTLAERYGYSKDALRVNFKRLGLPLRGHKGRTVSFDKRKKSEYGSGRYVDYVRALLEL